jgi:hypothetical protein
MNLIAAFCAALRDIGLFAEYLSGVRLRGYQRQAAEAILRSVIKKEGLTFVVIFPRQSGKNELQAQIEAYLLALLQNTEAEIVKVSPTWKPQSQNAMRRLERVLARNLITRYLWRKEQGYIYRVGKARIYFLSAEPSAHIVGATASTLLECDEAQDVLIRKWDKEINPMAASTNATRVFYGTAWTSQTLLAREKRLALEAQRRDGVQRVFEITADQARKEAKAYGKFVDGEIARLGRNHPFVRTQFFSEEIDEQVGFFTAERLAFMQGEHPPQLMPAPGAIYVFCIDVGGEEPPGRALLGEAGDGREREHDSTCLTIFEVDLSTLADEGLRAPTFRVVHRRKWTGAGQPQLYAEINALANLWSPHRMVIDATGLGEGLAAYLERAHAGRLLRFKFTQSSKSDLGWKFIAIIDSGRYKEHRPPLGEESRDALYQEEFFAQARACGMEILPGPGRILRWSVPESARHPLTGEPLHDDWIFSAALCAALYNEAWGNAESAIILPQDPLQGLRF